MIVIVFPNFLELLDAGGRKPKCILPQIKDKDSFAEEEVWPFMKREITTRKKSCLLYTSDAADE